MNEIQINSDNNRRDTDISGGFCRNVSLWLFTPLIYTDIVFRLHNRNTDVHLQQQ